MCDWGSSDRKEGGPIIKRGARPACDELFVYKNPTTAKGKKSGGRRKNQSARPRYIRAIAQKKSVAFEPPEFLTKELVSPRSTSKGTGVLCGC